MENKKLSIMEDGEGYTFDMGGAMADIIEMMSIMTTQICETTLISPHNLLTAVFNDVKDRTEGSFDDLNCDIKTGLVARKENNGIAVDMIGDAMDILYCVIVILDAVSARYHIPVDKVLDFIEDNMGSVRHVEEGMLS